MSVSDMFVECMECRAKPGAPSLCVPCIQNRFTIARLRAERDEALTKVAAQEKLIESWRAYQETLIVR